VGVELRRVPPFHGAQKGALLLGRGGGFPGRRGGVGGRVLCSRGLLRQRRLRAPSDASGGCSYTKEGIAKALEGVDTHGIFAGSSAEDIVSLLSPEI
jgi:hypothetical protein